jgi:hypothetical protein
LPSSTTKNTPGRGQGNQQAAVKLESLGKTNPQAAIAKTLPGRRAGKNGAKFSEAAQRDAAHRQPQTPAGPLHRTSGTSHPDRQEQPEHNGVIGYLRGR